MVRLTITRGAIESVFARSSTIYAAQSVKSLPTTTTSNVKLVIFVSAPSCASAIVAWPLKTGGTTPGARPTMHSCRIRIALQPRQHESLAIEVARLLQHPWRIEATQLTALDDHDPVADIERRKTMRNDK